jgi:DNA polymerase-3 subunit beta
MARGSQGENVSAQVVSLPSGSLKAALATVIAAVEARSTIPILSNVLIRVTKTHLSVTATDLDIELTRQVPVTDASGSWGTTVQARVLKAAVDKLPKESEVMLSLVEGRITMACGRARFTLPVLPVDDFPFIATADWAAQFEMTGSVLAEALAHVKPGMSSEETRYYLNGVLIERCGVDLVLAATDGHRLHVVVLPAPDGSEPLADIDQSLIVPRKAVPIIAGLCGEARIEIALAQGKMRIDSGETVMVTKLIDGNFPDWRRVVPVSAPNSCSIDPRALEAALARVNAINTSKDPGVKLAIDTGDITLSVRCPESGEASETLEHAGLNGEPCEIGFNPRYLADVLAQLPGESAAVQFSDAQGPAKWSKAEDRFCVLMPMRV